MVRRQKASTRTAMQPTFGTLEWGKKNNGVLTRTERVQFLRNMAFRTGREVTDVIRANLGLLNPVNLDFSDLTPPDTRMAKDAEEFARDTHTQDLLSHGYRTYYFGAMIAAYRKLKYDKEVYFSAAILHDIGLTESRISPLTQCCFTVYDAARKLTRSSWPTWSIARRSSKSPYRLFKPPGLPTKRSAAISRGELNGYRSSRKPLLNSAETSASMVSSSDKA